MKWVFYALLVANAWLFSWQLRHYEPQPVEVDLPEPSRGNVNRLLLLSEVDTGELARRAVGGMEGVGGEGGESPGSGGASAEAPAGEGGALAAAAPATDGEAQAAGPDPGPPVPGTCFSVGPLLGDEEAQSMTDWIEGNGGSGRLRVDERREVALYWVYFPPLASRQAAVERVLQLRQDDIDDIYIIPRGDMANAISLGVYSRTSTLDRRLRELRTRGYQPEVVPRYRTRRAYWFDAHFPEGFVFPRESFGAAFPTAEMVPVTCRARTAAAGAPLPRDYTASDSPREKLF